MRALPEVRARNHQGHVLPDRPLSVVAGPGTVTSHCSTSFTPPISVELKLHLFICRVFTAVALEQSRCSINVSPMNLMSEWVIKRETLGEGSHWKHGVRTWPDPKAAAEVSQPQVFYLSVFHAWSQNHLRPLLNMQLPGSSLEIQIWQDCINFPELVFFFNKHSRNLLCSVYLESTD